MKSSYLIICLFLILLLADLSFIFDVTGGKHRSVAASAITLPLYFIENQGQLDKQIHYYVQGSEMSLYFTSQGIIIALSKRSDKGGEAIGYTLKVDFVRANPYAKPQGESRTEAVFSYFQGSKSQWKTGLRSYNSLVYEDLWPGIDLVYRGTVNQLKYSFIVKPGAVPDQIRLAYKGATSVSINGAGELNVATPVADIKDDKPYTYQEAEGKQVEISSSYVIRDSSDGAHEYGFRIGSYDNSKPLVIDPAVLINCGYIGGNSADIGRAIAVDRAGNVYVTGSTVSGQMTFPVTVGPDLTRNGVLADAFVAKMNRTGTALLYCGYIGGTGHEEGRGIAVDTDGNAYIVGETNSSEGLGFPVTVGPDITHGGNLDGFIAKVNATGTALVYCGYIGGSMRDEGYAVTVNSSGQAYVTGSTQSSATDGFPVVVGPDLTHNSAEDAFISKINQQGTGFIYSGYIGGQFDDIGYGIALDDFDNPYIAGVTHSPESQGFPVKDGPDLTFNGTFDGFIAKIDNFLVSIDYCGYIGGDRSDEARDVVVDSLGHAFITGGTNSLAHTFPLVVGPDLTTNGNTEAFIAKVKASGLALDYCGYIGGDADDAGYGVAVDDAGSAYVVGHAFSDENSFPVINGPDLTHNSPGTTTDAFISKINPAGTAFVYSGFIGGSSSEHANAIALDTEGNAYITGLTSSTQSSFPVTVGPDLTHNGDSDVFVAKVSPSSIFPTSASFTANGGTGPVAVTSLTAWMAVSNSSFITISSGSNGNGNGTVIYSVAANSGPSIRTGTLTINGETITIYQADASSTLSPTSASFTPNGGPGLVFVTATGSWTAASNVSWIRIDSGSSGTGDGSVNYTVSTYSGGSPRTGSITINDDLFIVYQGGRLLDVPESHLFFTEISKLYAHGVTLGCGGGNYCPDDPVLRDQMAAFIMRALGEFDPPTPAMQRFVDVPPSNAFYAFIDRLAIRQITLGCTPNMYCPTDPVLRDQMAAFIIRALHPPGYIPPTPAMQRFLDVPPTNPFYAHIEEMAVRGITLGCGGGNYCPSLVVSRGQMAAFLVRAFNL